MKTTHVTPQFSKPRISIPANNETTKSPETIDPFTARFNNLPTTRFANTVGPVMERLVRRTKQDLVPQTPQGYLASIYVLGQTLGTPTGLHALTTQTPFMVGVAPPGAEMVADATLTESPFGVAPPVEAWTQDLSALLPARAKQLYGQQFLRDGVNCHGVALYVAGITEEVRFVFDSELNLLRDLLGTERVSADDAHPGDLFHIHRRYLKNEGRGGMVKMDEPVHTAVYVGKGLAFSKDGATRRAQPEIESFRELFNQYYVPPENRDGTHQPVDGEETSWVEYVRINPDHRNVWEEIRQDPELAPILEQVTQLENRAMNFMLGNTDTPLGKEDGDAIRKLWYDSMNAGKDPDLNKLMEARVYSLMTGLGWSSKNIANAPVTAKPAVSQYEENIYISGLSPEEHGHLKTTQVKIQINDGDWITMEDPYAWNYHIDASEFGLEPGEELIVKARSFDEYGGGGIVETTKVTVNPF